MLCILQVRHPGQFFIFIVVTLCLPSLTWPLRFAGGRSCRGRWAVLQERRSRENAEKENVLATVGGAPGAPGTLAQQHVARADRSETKKEKLPALTWWM